MGRIEKFQDAQLQRICDVLADTGTGLTGSEIGRILSALGIEDPFPTATKRHRLDAALNNRQQKDGCGNLVVGFIYRAMDPVLYTDNHLRFEMLRRELNQVLAFCGYTLGEDQHARPRLRELVTDL